MNTPVQKMNTAKIVMSEPDEDLMKTMLQGRQVTPGLAKFLRNLVKTKKWTRKITLPSDYENAAVALVFSSSLKESGLEIVTELHVFFDDKVIVEEWQVLGEKEKASNVPKEAFTSMGIRKVYVDRGEVRVELNAPLPGGDERIIEKTFDFNAGASHSRSTPHPLLQEEDAPQRPE